MLECKLFNLLMKVFNTALNQSLFCLGQVHNTKNVKSSLSLRSTSSSHMLLPFKRIPHTSKSLTTTSTNYEKLELWKGSIRLMNLHLKSVPISPEKLLDSRIALVRFLSCHDCRCWICNPALDSGIFFEKENKDGDYHECHPIQFN